MLPRKVEAQIRIKMRRMEFRKQRYKGKRNRRNIVMKGRRITIEDVRYVFDSRVFKK